MAPDGYPYIAWSIGVGVVASFLGITLTSHLLLYGAAVCAVAALLFLNFFRDPERIADAGPDDIISPGDGRVVAIQDETEENYFHSAVKRVSIFLSVFDVHVNRIPIDGSVEYFRYIPGSFSAAFRETASRYNEQTAIGISDGSQKVLFKQIAGVLARRIVCTVEKGQSVRRGDRCGIIKFGSRVDVVMPEDTEILVKKGQKVFGGTTPVGRFKT